MYLYSVLFYSTEGVPHTQGTQAWITQIYLQLHQCLPLPRKRSLDDASSDWGCGHLIAAYYEFIYPERMKGWVGLVGWPTADGLLNKWSPVSCRWGAGQGKFAGQGPTFYHCATQVSQPTELSSHSRHCTTTDATPTSPYLNVLSTITDKQGQELYLSLTGCPHVRGTNTSPVSFSLHTNSYWCSTVTMALSCTVSEIFNVE